MPYSLGDLSIVWLLVERSPSLVAGGVVGSCVMSKIDVTRGTTDSSQDVCAVIHLDHGTSVESQVNVVIANNHPFFYKKEVFVSVKLVEGGAASYYRISLSMRDISYGVTAIRLNKLINPSATLVNLTNGKFGSDIVDLIKAQNLSPNNPASGIVRGDDMFGAGSATWIIGDLVVDWHNQGWVDKHYVLECVATYTVKSHTYMLKLTKLDEKKFLFACRGFCLVGLSRMFELVGGSHEVKNVLDGRELVRRDVLLLVPSLRLVVASMDGMSALEVRKAWKSSPYSTLLVDMDAIIRFFKSDGWFSYVGLTNTSGDTSVKLSDYVLRLSVRYRELKSLTPQSVIVQILEFIKDRSDLKNDPLVMDCLKLLRSLTSGKYFARLGPNGEVQLRKFCLLFAFSLGVDLRFKYSLTPGDHRKQKGSAETGSVFVPVDYSAPVMSPKDLRELMKSMMHAEKVINPARYVQLREYTVNAMDLVYLRKWVSMLYRTAKYRQNHPLMQRALKQSGKSLEDLWYAIDASHRYKNWKGIRSIKSGEGAIPLNLALHVVFTDYYHGNIKFMPKYFPGKSSIHTTTYWILQEELKAAQMVVTKICRDNCTPGEFMPVFEGVEDVEVPKMLLPLPASPKDGGILGDAESAKFLYRSRKISRPKPKNLIVDKDREISYRQAMASFGYSSATNEDLVSLLGWLNGQDISSSTSFWGYYSQMSDRSLNSPFGKLRYPTPFHPNSLHSYTTVAHFKGVASDKVLARGMVYDPKTVDMDSIPKLKSRSRR